MRSVLASLVVVVIACTAAIVAQTSTPLVVFDAASIKPNKSADPRADRGIGTPGNRFEGTNLTLHELIAFAYGHPGVPFRRLSDEEIAGDQGWMMSDRFDIVATASHIASGPDGNDQKLAMLRALLIDRFKLTTHLEMRTASVYFLTLARGNKVASSLHRSDVDCRALAMARGGAPQPSSASGPRPPCSSMVALGPTATLASSDLPISSLAAQLSRLTGRAVVDQTGLSGAFDLELHFDPVGLPGLAAIGPLPDLTGRDGVRSSAPSLFTALQEQLGLKVTAGNGRIDVLVVDNAERPSED